MPDSLKAEKTSSFHQVGPAALAAKFLDRDAAKLGDARSQVVEGKVCGLGWRAEALIGQDTLNKTGISEYPLVTFDTFRTLLHLRPRSVASQQPASGKVRSLSSGKAALHERQVVTPCSSCGGAEVKEYVIDVLPGKGRLTHEGAMAGIGIAGEFGKACGYSCS